MRGTSACCPQIPDRCRGRGFTLLELLVVLMLVAIVTGLVAPATLRGLDAARERGIATDLRAQLEGLPVRAFQQGTGLELDATALRRLVPDLPADWDLAVEPVLRYGPTGMAAEASVRLQAPGRQPIAWRIAPISGAVIDSTAGRGPS